MRSSAHQLAFLESFADRPPHDCIKIDLAGFDKYNLNIAGFIANLRWSEFFSNRETTTFPDAVAQFYCNLQLSENLMNGIFTMFVDGYLLSITPRLLAMVLKVPCSGLLVFSEAELSLHDFSASNVLKRWIPTKSDDTSYAPASRLPDIHRTLHYLITNVFLPRTDAKFVVTPLDAWIIRCSIANVALDYSSLMWAHMVKYVAHPSTEALPFSNEISTLLVRLGLRLSKRFVSHNLVCRLSAQHVLRTIK
ncbi:hypothetical protein LINGRAPRIM_LOCUS2629 [Linum grandiflorum]